MLSPFDYFEHRRACQAKQAERANIIADLPAAYKGPVSEQERSILEKPVSELVRNVQNHTTQPIDILRAYGKVALKAHEKTNCLTEVMITDAAARAEKKTSDVHGPLAGIPISLKDTVGVKGFDASVGYSSYTGKPWAEDGAMVRLLRDAGAIPYVKTNIPITLLSFESANDVWGRCRNPHNVKYSPGGSTGGEGALLAFGGGRIGIGSDVAGSVRAPAHFCGIYSLRCSTGRWPKLGISTSMPGQEGILSVYSPMTRTLGDLVYFTKSIIEMKPWRYDYSVHPVEWRGDQGHDTRNAKRLRFGVMRTDGVIDPSPACVRALDTVVDALKADGHEVFNVEPPSPYNALVIASVLLTSDGCKTYRSPFRTGERNDSGAAQMNLYMSLPRPIKYLHYLWVRYVRRHRIWAGLLRHFHPKTAAEQWQWVAKRESYKAQWHEWWQNEAQVDFLLTPPNATPAVPHDGMRDAVSSCGYTFLFNLLDYTCGIIPITHVDRALDALPSSFKLRTLNGAARGAYKHYDADAMHGLPVAVQLVGRRLEEEKVLAGMERVESALEKQGKKYELMEIE